MYSRVYKLVAAALAALMMLLVFATPVMGEAVEGALEEAQPAESAPEEPVQEEAEVVSEQVEAAETAAEAESDAEPAPEQELIDIPETPVPLAGGPEPSVTVRAGCDIDNLQIGDELVLIAELNGFDGMEPSIRWQAREDGQWKDLQGETGTRLTIEVTRDNAGFAYRAAVDVRAVA